MFLNQFVEFAFAVPAELEGIKMKIIENQSVMGVVATAARPDLRGFIKVGIVMGAPVVTLLFGVEAVIRWALQMM